jgi:nitrile hydratase accessory protein
VSLSRNGLFKWDEFRERLIAEINGAKAGDDYYHNWLRALEGVLAGKGTLIANEIEHELASLAASPPHPQRHSHPPDRPLKSFPGRRGN